MLYRSILLTLAMTLTTPAFANHLVLTVSLSKNSITIVKQNKRGKSVLVAPIIPVAPGSLQPGVYKALRMTDRYQSKNGNVILNDVVRTDGRFNLRSSRMFAQWLASKAPVNRAIVMDPENGSMLFTVIKKYGVQQTEIHIVP